jgi:GTPase SAR1 family protein
MMSKSFLRGTHGIILAADLTSAGSMEGLDAMYDRVKALAGFADDLFPCVLIGNKFDLIQDDASAREITREALEKWARLVYVAQLHASVVIRTKKIWPT